ncbi:telomere repeat binding factor-domain-containing protein [Podospora didyma]|uniref:Telomere repeat binding factor-domain-containing protein n=1 Tax=Podospora didyma TaxID=330526 RepID=A0AAE0NTV3_9PEZI|nr:telomere repeat binding factor-domain-containing protein [Podospora didyma]
MADPKSALSQSIEADLFAAFAAAEGPIAEHGHTAISALDAPQTTHHDPQPPHNHTLAQASDLKLHQPESFSTAQEFPKRSRSPDLFLECDAKRRKTEQMEEDHSGLKEEAEHGGAPNLDLAAMLNDALASFDAQSTEPSMHDHDAPLHDHNAPLPDHQGHQQHHDTQDHHGHHSHHDAVIHEPDMHGGDINMAMNDPIDTTAVTSAPSATATPGLERATKIMKVSTNSTYMMRSMSLPVLGNLAVQILVRLSSQPRAETELLLSDPDSEFRKAFDILRNTFALVRKMFSDYPLLFPDELDISDSEDRETIRMSNLAATAASVLVDKDVALEDVHDYMLSIFVPEDGEYKDSLTELLVGLKTRVFLDAFKDQPETPHTKLVAKFFPNNFDELLKQRSGDEVLSADEERLVHQLNERTEFLLHATSDESAKVSLESQFSLENFIENMSTFLQGHLSIVVEYAEKYGVNIPLSEDGPGMGQVSDENSPHEDLGLENHTQESQGQDEQRQENQGRENASEENHGQEIGPQEHDDLAALLQSVTAAHLQNGITEDMHTGAHLEEHAASSEDVDGLDLRALLEQSLSNHVDDHVDEPKSEQINHDGSHESTDLFDTKDLASLIAEKLDDLDTPHGLPDMSTSSYSANNHENGVGMAHDSGYSVQGSSSHADVHPQYLAQLNQTHSSPYQPYTQAPPAPPAAATGDNLPPNQSSPTAVLYERARQAAVAKSSNTARREGLHSTRRPWTPEEEKALMTGLDIVKGPHWSQILGIFGANGSHSDILKDRTQVQLKDKARNLKLFFLKTNSEMPYYLQSVTGELKTRAPSQAARKEAEEKARMNLEEEQARIQGIMTLAGGLQNNHHPATSSPLATSSPARVNPIAPAAQGAANSGSQTQATSASGLPHVAISPMVKSEPTDYHSLSHVNKLPQIQPALAPAPPTPIALKPQPQPHHPSQHQSNHHQQQQAHQPQHSHQQQQQQQHQHHLQQHHQHQQSQQNQHHQQQQQQPQQQQQSQLHQPPPQSQSQYHGAQTSPQSQAHKQTQNNQIQNYELPPIPPNHHSTPEQVQDKELYETLQALIAEPSANDRHEPETSEGSAK